jgi:hypothetical protein
MGCHYIMDQAPAKARIRRSPWMQQKQEGDDERRDLTKLINN